SLAPANQGFTGLCRSPLDQRFLHRCLMIRGSRMKARIAIGVGGLLLMLAALVTPLYQAHWRLPEEPSAFHRYIGPPLEPVRVTVQQIRPAKHNQDCFWPMVEFVVPVNLARMKTYERRPIASFRITSKGTTDQIRIVRSSGSIEVDKYLLEQIAQHEYDPS